MAFGIRKTLSSANKFPPALRTADLYFSVAFWHTYHLFTIRAAEQSAYFSLFPFPLLKIEPHSDPGYFAKKPGILAPPFGNIAGKDAKKTIAPKDQ